MSQHEELEVGQHLDQTLRTALTGAAQVAERLARGAAERDRVAAQALRDQLLHRQGLPTDPALDTSARRDATLADPGPIRSDPTLDTSPRPEPPGPGGPVPGAGPSEPPSPRRSSTGQVVRDALTDATANVHEQAAEARVAAQAAREEAMIVLPGGRDNLDRGVSPTKAATPQEAQHRRQAWTQARQVWQEQNRATLPHQAAARAAWDQMPMEAKTQLYWQQYDTRTARTVPAGGDVPATVVPERSTSPSKAPTAEEAARRRSAWREAEQGFVSGLVPSIGEREARQAWKDLDWPDKALRYWSAYERADQAGALEPGRMAPAQALTRERVVELNEVAAAFFTDQLARPGNKGRTYLEERLGAEAIDASPYTLGYAPSGWNSLTTHLRRSGASDQEIVGAGLGRMSSRGTVIDAFRDRAVVAIRDAGDGATIGFVGRDLSGDPAAPRYTNTTATPAYTKGAHLLGLHEAPEDARLVRVEGPLDMLAVTAAGEGRYVAVAALGTALTDVQADVLAERSGGRIWEALDGDAAGCRATEDDFWMMQGRGVDARLVILPSGTDPAQLWRENPELLRLMLASAEVAPSAGLAVLDNALRDLENPLRAGEASAFEKFEGTVARVSSAVPTEHDRALLARYAEGALATGREPFPATGPGGADRASGVGAVIGEAEGVNARVVSAAGWAQSTRDMLAEARHGAGSAARPALGPEASLDRGQELRR